MKKFFKHFSNWKDESKIVKLRNVHGIEGYGIYLMLIEILHQQKALKYEISKIEDLSYEFHTSIEKIQSVLFDFDLFDIQNGFFFSKSINNL